MGRHVFITSLALAMVSGPVTAQDQAAPDPLLICAGDAVMLAVLFDRLPEAAGSDPLVMQDRMTRLHSLFSLAHSADTDCSLTEAETDAIVAAQGQASFDALQARMAEGETLDMVVVDVVARVDACTAAAGAERLRTLIQNAQNGQTPCGWSQ